MAICGGYVGGAVGAGGAGPAPVPAPGRSGGSREEDVDVDDVAVPVASGRRGTAPGCGGGGPCWRGIVRVGVGVVLAGGWVRGDVVYVGVLLSASGCLFSAGAAVGGVAPLALAALMGLLV
jgi:hypothetical protein